jgi:phosphatidylglycerol---prolipoprotein diacylglyceryl transferase
MERLGARPAYLPSVMFVLLWWYASKPRKTRAGLGMFLIGYGVFRFVAEYFREPDSFLGLLALGMSMGQWLCLPMIAGGAGLWWWGIETAPEGRACDRSSSTPKPPA